MKIKGKINIFASFIFLLAACAMPQLSEDLLTQENQQTEISGDSGTATGLNPAADAENTTETGTLSIDTDTGRTQGVYINEKGLYIDIESIDESSGEVFKCIEAVDIAVLTPPESPEDTPDTAVKAIIVGKREDGLPGIWEIHKDDSIHSPWNEETENRTSVLPDSAERMNYLKNSFGWTYEVAGISDDGKMVIGNAVHEEGFTRGKWTIDPGTTVGVYWRLWKPDADIEYSVSRARVIGIKKAPFPYGHEKRRPDFRSRRLNRLRLFFLDWFETYLTEAESINYDEENEMYLVRGTDQSGTTATAGIDFRRGVLTINQDTEPETGPDLTITSITVPDTSKLPSDIWELGARVSNIDDTADSGESTLKYYLSTDEVLDITEDTLIGSKSIGSIPAGSYIDDVWSTSFSIDVIGTWYIFAVADADSEIEESSEDNNYLSGIVSIISDSSRIVIETFSPTGLYTTYTDTCIAVFDSNGDPAPETPYDDAGALSADDNSNPSHLLYSYIDFPDGLSPGTYYIKVRGSSSNQIGPYGIRIVSEPSTSYSYFTETNPAESPWIDSYESDDSMTDGVPDSPVNIGVGGIYNRALADSDIDWYVLTVN